MLATSFQAVYGKGYRVQGTLLEPVYLINRRVGSIFPHNLEAYGGTVAVDAFVYTRDWRYGLA